MIKTKYRWIKIKDILGEEYSYESCEVYSYLNEIVIIFPAPLGIDKKHFMKKNLIYFEGIKEADVK